MFVMKMIIVRVNVTLIILVLLILEMHRSSV